MDYQIDLVNRDDGSRAILLKENGGLTSVIGRYGPSGFIEGEMEYIHFDDRFTPSIEGKDKDQIVVPIFISGMASTSKRHIKFKSEGLEFVVDLDEHKVTYLTSAQV